MSTPPDDLLSSIEKINDYRARILAGETIAPEELHRALAALRNNRAAVSVPKEKKEKKEKISSIPVNLADLFAK